MSSNSPCFRHSDSTPSARDPRPSSLHHLKHLVERGHGGIPRRSHRQRAVRGAALHSPLRILAGKKTVDQAGSERVASAHAIQDFQIVAVGGLKKRAVAVTDRAPIVLCCRGGLAQRGGYYLEGKIFDHLMDHLAESLWV